MPRAEVILLQFDIAGHSKIQLPARHLQQARKLLQQYISSLVDVRTKSGLSWAGDGGWCWFRVNEQTNFAIGVDAAVDILGMVSRINEILQRDHIIEHPLAIRLSADTMNVELDDDPSHFCASQMNSFMKNERDIGLVNCLVVTKRIADQLQPALRRRLDYWRHSDELETDLYVYDGKKLRNDALHEVRNRSANPEAVTPTVLSVTTFEGDRYSELCKHAYSDVECDPPIANVESLRFLAFRNGLANAVLAVIDSFDNGEMHRKWETRQCLELAAASQPYELMLDCEFPIDGHRLRRELDANRVEGNCGHNVGSPLHFALNACKEDIVYKGGEQVRFFNADALGFVSEIGDNTLLDHASAGSLEIVSVTGGVERDGNAFVVENTQ
jgi:hypothetical protein